MNSSNSNHSQKSSRRLEGGSNCCRRPGSRVESQSLQGGLPIALGVLIGRAVPQGILKFTAGGVATDVTNTSIRSVTRSCSSSVGCGKVLDLVSSVRYDGVAERRSKKNFLVAGDLQSSPESRSCNAPAVQTHHVGYDVPLFFNFADYIEGKSKNAIIA